jgi:PKD repeat protein
VVTQWDITLPTPDEINDSRITVGISSAAFIGALQLATDGKIYLAKIFENDLGVIENPNVAGTGCNYDDDGISVSPNICNGGLPNILPFLVGNVSLLPSAAFQADVASLCDSGCIHFSDASLNNPETWEWWFPGATPEISMDQNPQNICYAAPGVYDVQLIITNTLGADTLLLPGYVTVNQSPVAAITAAGNVLAATASSSYQWFFNGQEINGALAQTYTALETGSYSVIITDTNGCSATAEYFFNLAAFSANDTTVCEKFCVDFFDLSFNNPVEWAWTFEGASPNTSSEKNPVGICYDDPGVYYVSLLTTDAVGNLEVLFLDNYITVFQNPFAPLITQDGNTLTASAAASYQWYFNGNEIPGATSQSYMMAESGFYTVQITDENGCHAQSSIKAYLTGIEETAGGFSMQLLENPAQDLLTVELTAQQEVQIDLINALGQLVYTAEIKTFSPRDQMVIPVQPLTAGSYLIRGISGSDLKTMKWIKQ